MPRNHATVRREPFLTPIWLMAVGALLGVALLGIAIWVWATAGTTLIVVLRDAETAQGGPDSPLAPAGEARASVLSRMFGDLGTAGRIDALYVSASLRDRMTAAPLAARLTLTPILVAPDDLRRLARRVLREHGGGRVVVVVPPDAVDPIVEALSGVAHLAPVGEHEYGTLYLVSVPRIGRPNLLRLSY